jgi:hypothetical protein
MKIHYAGALEIRRGDRVTKIAEGYAACCSGRRANKIRGQGNHTWMLERVTCKPCMRLLTLSASQQV